MRKAKIRKGCLAGALALLMVVASLSLSGTFAAGLIDTEKKCSLTLSTTGADYAADIETIDEVHAKLYRVAEVSDTAVYTAIDAFAEDTEVSKVSNLKTRGDSSDWAQTWEDLAAAAAKVVESKNVSATKTITMQPDAATGTSIGTATDLIGTATDLETGLYLVVVETAQSSEYEYSFSPYLVALPGSEYRQTGSYGTGEDEWNYDQTVGLKPERTARYGQIEIVKSLKEFNASLGDVTFVFQVTATRAEDGNPAEVVYDNVVSITFAQGEPLTKSVVIDNLPAGSVVTVKEVYSGGSYIIKPGTSDSAEETVAADEVKPVQFENTYNDRTISGYGVTNHYTYKVKEVDGIEIGGYDWEQWRDNTGNEQ